MLGGGADRIGMIHHVRKQNKPGSGIIRCLDSRQMGIGFILWLSLMILRYALPYASFLNENRTNRTVLMAHIGLELAVRAGGDNFTADEDHEACGWACVVRNGSINIIVVDLFIGLLAVS